MKKTTRIWTICQPTPQYFDSLEQICYAYNRDPEQLKAYLLSHGYVYSVEQRQMRPEGYDR